MPLITVLLPVYNGERFLADAIRSVLNQTFQDFELLIVDDGSTDGSAGVIRSFNDPRIRVIRNEKRLKLSGALNRGMDSAGGTYIARMDADDVSRPERLAWQVRFMESHPEIGMCGGWVRAIGDHSSSGDVFRYPLDGEEIRASLLFGNPFAHPSVIFRKDLFDRFSLRFDGSYYPAEDRELWTRALENIRAANIGRVLLEYRLHPDSMTMSGSSDMDMQAVRILKPEIEKLGLRPTPEEVLFHQYISTERLAPEWSVESIDRADGWLKRLVVANDETGRYDRRAFRKAAAKVWFNLCYRSLNYGWSVFSRYRASSLSSATINGRVMMFLAMIKGAAIRSWQQT